MQKPESGRVSGRARAGIGIGRAYGPYEARPARLLAHLGGEKRHESKRLDRTVMSIGLRRAQTVLVSGISHDVFLPPMRSSRRFRSDQARLEHSDSALIYIISVSLSTWR